MRCGLGHGPGGDDLTGDDRREHTCLLLVAARAGERGGNHVGGEERTRRDVRTEGVGDERQVDNAGAADAAAPEVFGNEERRPSELRTLAPVVTLETSVRGGELAHLHDRAFALQELPSGVSEELLVVAQRDFHPCPSLLILPADAAILARIEAPPQSGERSGAGVLDDARS